MLLMVFQTAQNVALSQVHGACVSHAIFFYSLIYSKTRKTIEKNGMRDTGSMHLWQGNVLRSLEYHQQHAHRCFYNRVLMPKNAKTSEGETVNGQNIQTLQHTLCWTPAPPKLNVSARVLAKVMLRVWFLSSIGANAPQAASTLNFGGEGGVSDRKVLCNISSIYSIPHH